MESNFRAKKSLLRCEGPLTYSARGGHEFLDTALIFTLRRLITRLCQKYVSIDMTVYVFRLNTVLKNIMNQKFTTMKSCYDWEAGKSLFNPVRVFSIIFMDQSVLWA